jgi:hypothetical protein
MFIDYRLLERDTFLRKISQFLRAGCLLLLGRRTTTEMETACIPKHLCISVTRGRWICHDMCKGKLKWEGERMEGTRHTSDCISKHNIANNIKMCHCHWRLGIWCVYKSLHFNSWVLLSPIRDGVSHHICHVICLLMSVLCHWNTYMRDQGHCCFGCEHAPLGCGAVGQCSWLWYWKSARNLLIHFMPWYKEVEIAHISMKVKLYSYF